MKIRYNTTSPFVRKVMVFAHEVGLADKLERVTTNVWDPQDDLPEVNPVGKIPALILDDGTVYTDSLLICQYLDTLHGGRRLAPPESAGDIHWKVLQRHNLGHPIIEAVQMRVFEKRREPELRSQEWMDWQGQRILRIVGALEKTADWLEDEVTLAHTTLAVGLGYIDFRAAELDWRTENPRLAAWHAAFDKRPSMQENPHREWRK